MKIRKPKIETISKKHSSFIDTIHCHFRTSVLKQLLILIESPNIFNWNSVKKTKMGLLSGIKFGSCEKSKKTGDYQ